MINKLITLADKLDEKNFKEAADFIDNFLKNAKEQEDDPAKEWEDVPTRVGVEITPPSVPPLTSADLEQSSVMDGMEIAGQLRNILHRAPNPEKWDQDTKIGVLKLIDRLREIL